MRTSRLAASALTALLSLAALAVPASAELADRKLRKIEEAARVLEAFLRARDAEIPRELLADARCVMLLPDVAKGAFGIGGRYGKGMISCRLDGGGWSPPGFVEIGGASIGWQVGAEYVDLLLVVRNRRGLDALLASKVTLGADASVAAGPYGRTAQAATDAQLKAALLSWSRSRGLFAGVSLDGAVLKQDKSDNRDLYGRRISLREIVQPRDGEVLPVPAAARPFAEAVERLVPARE